MIPDEHLIAFRLDEALRHLREAEKLIPENTKQWRFLLGAQTAVEAVQQLQREEQSGTEKRWERSEIEHHYRISWRLRDDDVTVQLGAGADKQQTFDGVGAVRRAKEMLEILRGGQAKGICSDIVVEHRTAKIARNRWETVQEVGEDE